MVNAWRNDPLHVPGRYASLRFWRHTSIASLGAVDEVILPRGLLGHEWDEDLLNGHRPAGLMHLSHTVIDDVQYMIDEGATYDTGTATHHLTLYRHRSGALVFGAGTCQWSWGLDGHHDLVGGLDLQLGKNCYSLRVGTDTERPDGERDVQQATLNLFADMGVRPSTPQPELHLTAPSDDSSPPRVCGTARRTPRGLSSEGAREETADGGALADGSAASLQGWSEDVGGGVVAAVEVSLDGGVTWRAASVEPASGDWSLSDGAPHEGGTVRVRAADDSGNLSPEVVVVCSCCTRREAGCVARPEVASSQDAV